MTDRLPPFDPASATDEQKAVLADILSGPRGNLNGPFLGWIASPELAQHAQKLGAFCRYRTGRRRRRWALAIRGPPARGRSPAEGNTHHPSARAAGGPPATADAIRRGVAPAFESDDDALIHAFATELYDTRRVSDATFARAQARFGHETVVNLVALLGYYALVAMTLNTFGMRAEGQTDLPFPE